MAKFLVSQVAKGLCNGLQSFFNKKTKIQPLKTVGNAILSQLDGIAGLDEENIGPIRFQFLYPLISSFPTKTSNLSLAQSVLPLVRQCTVIGPPTTVPLTHTYFLDFLFSKSYFQLSVKGNVASLMIISLVLHNDLCFLNCLHWREF